LSFGSIVFTNKGHTLEAKAQSGIALMFTRIAMGDGNLTGQSIRDLNNLVSHKKNIPITRLQPYADGTTNIGGKLTNSDMTQGFYWRELGLFAMDPDVGEVLYCYGNAAELAEYIPPGDSSQIIERIIELIAIVGNATNVTAIINNSLVYATPEDIENHNNDANAHTTLNQSVAANTQQISDLSGIMGLLSGLNTSIKTSIVAAINSLLTLASTTVNGLMSKDDKTKLNGIANSANNYTHPGSGTNPHGTTKTDVGLGNVLNYGIATTAESKVGTSDAKYMTPFRVAEFIEGKGLGATSVEYSGGNLNTLVGNIKVRGASMVGAPDADYWYVDQVVHLQGVWQYQLATGLTTTRKQERWLMNGVWAAWTNAGGGGDIMGTIFQTERPSVVTGAAGTLSLIKSYTNAKGGIIKFSDANYQTSDGVGLVRIVLDGVERYNGPLGQIYGIGPIYMRVEVSFMNSFEIYVSSSNGGRTVTLQMLYYLNP